MAVREQGAKARLRVLHFGKELFATVLGAAKHRYDAVNMRNVFMTIGEGDVAEERQWRRVVELRLPFIVALWLHQLHLQGDRGVTHGKVKGVVNSLKSTASGLSPAKREANSSLREVNDTNASVRVYVIGYTSSKVRKVL